MWGAKYSLVRQSHGNGQLKLFLISTITALLLHFLVEHHHSSSWKTTGGLITVAHYPWPSPPEQTPHDNCTALHHITLHYHYYHHAACKSSATWSRREERGGRGGCTANTTTTTSYTSTHGLAMQWLRFGPQKHFPSARTDIV